MSGQHQVSNETIHRPGNTRRFVRAGSISIILIVAAACIAFYRQAIIDQMTVWSFVPTTQLGEAVEQSGMNDTGKFYTYASRAQLLDRQDFNSACGSVQNEQTIVIGCYTLPEKRIHVFNVTDVRLDGAAEVTLAHEMLHAAYDRLSESEKEWLKTLLENEASKTTDQRLLDLIEHYKETEPDEVTNELHSIFGTEADSLSPELESYYSRYFRDRQIVINLKNGYEKVFTELRDRQDTLVEEMNNLSSTITKRRSEYDVTLAVLNADIENFNAWNQSGEATVNEFIIQKTALEERIAAVTSERVSIDRAIKEYTDKQAELESLNLQAEVLNVNINSKLQPAPSL